MSIQINKKTLIKAVVGVSIVGVVLFFIITYIALSLELNLQFYANRLNLDWWYYFTLDNSAILWVPLITIAILAVIVTIFNPLTSSTLRFLYNITQRQRRPTKTKCIIWNYGVVAGVGGVVMGWVIGFLFNAGYGIFVANYSGISYDFFPTLFSALSYPLNPGLMDINILFAYTFIIRPFIVLTIGSIIAKLILDIINAFIIRGRLGANPIKLAGSIAIIIGLFFFLGWLFLPNGAFDVVGSAAVLPVIAGFFAGLIIGIPLYIIGVIDPARYRGERFYKMFIALAIIGIIALPVVFLINAGWQGLYREANWNQWTWDTQLETQISMTRTAAGLTNFSEYTTQQLLDNRTFSDEQILSRIRTFDLQASRASMENQIGTLWEALADSDICFFEGAEYWIAPRKVSASYSFDWVQWHLIYTHSRGFLALNPVTGVSIDENQYETIFGVPYNHSIYFGEHPDNGYTILNNTNFAEIEGIRYSGPPDVTLSGLLNWWYIDDWGFKTGEETSYLIKRNIYDRVEGILLPYMTTGDDPYLVFDKASNKLYYCLDIILNFPSFSGYLQSNIVRWLGVVLIDTKYGTMDFYQYNNSYADIPYGFLNVYLDKYDWQAMPTWLIRQLKYPEILIEYQLSVDYTYHVTDRSTWRSGEDFFERPSYTDLHYIIYDLGYDLAYVGASIVEFKQAAIGNLVGLYIVENGKRTEYLGRVTFYRNGTVGQTQMIGLTAARSAYQQKDATYLQLLPNPRFGNYLIYPLAGSLYFVIPVYDITGQFKQTLKRVALVNAFDPSIIGIGNSTAEAYSSLNVTTVIPQGVLSLNIISAPALTQDNTYQGTLNNLELLVNNGYIDQGFNVSIDVRTKSEYFNASFAGSEILPVYDGENYTYHIADFTLLPTQYVGIIPQITGRLPAGHPSTTIEYYVDLYFENGTLFDTKTRNLYVYQ